VPTLHVEDLDVDSSFVPASDAALAGVQNRQNAFQMGSGCLKTSNAQACIGLLSSHIHMQRAPSEQGYWYTNDCRTIYPVRPANEV
jgi:hypothetical protein